MNIYNWIQKTIFNTYEEWHMKSPIYDCNGFHIIGIDNSLKAMRDGYILYTEIRPQSAVKGCTSMRAVVGQGKELVDLYMEIGGKKYRISGLNYTDAVQIMRSFVKKSVLPEEKAYVEVPENDNEKLKDAFTELSKLLMDNSKQIRQFLNKVKTENEEDIEEAWIELYEELLHRGKALELACKSEKDDFILAVKKLSTGLELEIDEDKLDENEYIQGWSKVLNSNWEGYILAAMDVGSDSYVLMVLSKEKFNKAKELARVILQRIAAAEEM